MDFYDDVNDWLSVGGDLDLARDLTGRDFAATIAHLRGRGVTHVLDVRKEWNDKSVWVKAGLPEANYAHLPIEDSWRHTPAEAWYQGVTDFANRFWDESVTGDRLYVHCHMGINRAPSAAMLALLAVEDVHPMQAFLRIREARPIAGLVYAEAVGIWHLLNEEGIDDLSMSDELPESVVTFSQAMSDYWTPELEVEVGRGIAYYRSKEGGTIKVGGQTVLDCPNNSKDQPHQLKWNGGDPICLTCHAKPVQVERGA